MSSTENTQAAAIPFVVGQQVRARYLFRLERQLGTGTFAKVFDALCVDADNGDTSAMPRRMALKILRSDLDPSLYQLLRREISTLLAVNDSRVPRVLDWGTLEGGYPFVAMELFPAGSLQEHLVASGRPLTENAAWRLLADLLQAVTAAHRAAILHLDIKPANVLLDGHGGFVLTDFGCSQGLMMRGNAHGVTMVGTPAYCAPEQAELRPHDYDARTDLYSVGTTVWTALLGRTPKAVARELLMETPYPLPPVEKFRKEISKPMAKILRKLTMPERHLRPGSASEALEAVRAQLEGRPVVPKIPGHFLTEERLSQLPRLIVDPYLLEVVEGHLDRLFCVCFTDGEELIREGDLGHHALLLLHGEVNVERDGELLAIESRQGALLGEAAALTGTVRTATVRARGTVICAVFNGSELEAFLTDNPGLALRVVKGLCTRLARESKGRLEARNSGKFSVP